MAVDPTFPLYPIAAIISSVSVLLLFAMHIVYRPWTFGIVSLCFWLFWENLASGMNHIIWSDNSDVKAHLYCYVGMYSIPSTHLHADTSDISYILAGRYFCCSACLHLACFAKASQSHFSESYPRHYTLHGQLLLISICMELIYLSPERS